MRHASCVAAWGLLFSLPCATLVQSQEPAQEPPAAAVSEPEIHPVPDSQPQAPAEEAAVPEPRPLDALDWLVGEWIDQDAEAEVETSYRWTKNGAFLLQSFRMTTEADEDPLSGMQLIGWDPVKQTVRSWIYDSDGGFGEATWTQNGDRWTVRNAFTRPDGVKASSINVIQRRDDESYIWRSVSREVGGQLQPDVDPVVVVRKPLADEPTIEATQDPAVEPTSATFELTPTSPAAADSLGIPAKTTPSQQGGERS